MHNEGTGPLEGVNVLDLSAVVSGPLTATLLGDQGAKVIKVERLGTGDIQRHVGSKRNGYSGFFHMLNRGKHSIALDLGKPEAINITFCQAPCNKISQPFTIVFHLSRTAPFETLSSNAAISKGVSVISTGISSPPKNA